MDYKQHLMEIIDGVRDDFGVLGAFAFSGQGNIFDVNERFWRVYDAALKAKSIYEDELKKLGREDTTSIPWEEMEGFKTVLMHAGPPAMMANSALYGRYTMSLNSFFISAQQL